MAFSSEQETWLTEGRTDSRKYAAELEALDAKQTFLQNEVLQELADSRETLQANFKFDVKKVKKRWYAKDKVETTSSMSKEGDPDKEFDTWADGPGIEPMDDQKREEVKAAYEKVYKLALKMEEQGFSGAEIERELWTPLVRGEVIPENLVPDRFSNQVQVFNGACKIYEDKLKDFTKESSGHEKLATGLRIAQAGVTMVGTLVSESIKAANFDTLTLNKAELQKAGDDYTVYTDQKKALSAEDFAAWEADPANKDAVDAFNFKTESAEVNKALQAVVFSQAIANGALSTAENIATKKKGEETARGIMDAVKSAAVAAVTAFADAPSMAHSDDTKNLTSAISGAIVAAMDSCKVVTYLTEAARAPTSGSRKDALFAAVDAIAAAFASGFAAADTPAGDDKTSGKYALVGVAIRASILSAKNVGKAAEAMQKGDHKAAAMHLGIGTVSAVLVGSAKAISDGSRANTDKVGELNEFNELMIEDPDNPGKYITDKSVSGATLAKLRQDMADAQKAMSDALKINPATTMKNLEDEERKEKIKADMEKKAEEITQARLTSEFDEDFVQNLTEDPDFMKSVHEETEAEMEAFRDLLQVATVDPDAEADEAKIKASLDAIDRVMASVQADKMKLDIIDKVSAGGVKIVAAAFPGAGLAVAIRDFVADVVKLCQRIEERNLWLDNLELTMGNHSVYGPAIQSRVHSAKVQHNHRAIMVALDAVGIVAETLKLTPVSAAGAGISIGNNMAKALTEFGFKMYKEGEIIHGWKVYKDARDTPQNRKAARTAMRWNSTLSKCVMAYGAVMEKDAIAVQVVNRCGLNAEVLASDTDVCKKVVDYFQALYSDDPEVMHVMPTPSNWHPGKPELTLDSWLGFKTAACSKADPAMDKAGYSTPGIDNPLGNLRQVFNGQPTYKARRDLLEKRKDKARTEVAKIDRKITALEGEIADLETKAEENEARKADSKTAKKARGEIEEKEAEIKKLKTERDEAHKPIDRHARFIRRAVVECEILVDGFKRFAPKEASGKRHDGMADVVQSYTALAKMTLYMAQSDAADLP